MQSILDRANSEDAFTLDVQVIVDDLPNAALARCSTNDGCAATCASSCASRG